MSGIRVTSLANMYRMSESTTSTTLQRRVVLGSQCRLIRAFCCPVVGDTITTASPQACTCTVVTLRNWRSNAQRSCLQRNFSNFWLSSREWQLRSLLQRRGESTTAQQKSSEIKEILEKWTELQTLAEKTHPDREKASHCIHLLNGNVMSYYSTVLKKRQRQTTLDQFLVLKRLRPSEPEAGPSELQTLPRRERTPESQSPDVLMEGDSPSKQ